MRSLIKRGSHFQACINAYWIQGWLQDTPLLNTNFFNKKHIILNIFFISQGKYIQLITTVLRQFFKQYVQASVNGDLNHK